jgi:hypothetical protein
MTAIPITQKQVLEPPVELTQRLLPEDTVFVARWRDAGGVERELVLNATLTAPGLEELLNFCYEIGFQDATNPRLFVP